MENSVNQSSALRQLSATQTGIESAKGGYAWGYYKTKCLLATHNLVGRKTGTF
jgi:hypothetical protein